MIKFLKKIFKKKELVRYIYAEGHCDRDGIYSKAEGCCDTSCYRVVATGNYKANN